MACGDHGIEHQEDDNQFRPSVLACEEALARLNRCCGGFDPSLVQCEYYFSSDEGCGTSTRVSVEPAFTLAESHCIIATDCATLKANDVCGRAQKARATCSTESTNAFGTPTPAECPSGTPTPADPRSKVCP